MNISNMCTYMSHISTYSENRASPSWRIPVRRLFTRSPALVVITNTNTNTIYQYETTPSGVSVPMPIPLAWHRDAMNIWDIKLPPCWWHSHHLRCLWRRCSFFCFRSADIHCLQWHSDRFTFWWGIWHQI